MMAKEGDDAAAVKTVSILVNSYLAKMSAGIYQFKIRISSDNHQNDVSIEPVMDTEKQHDGDDDDRLFLLKPVGTFFGQGDYVRAGYVSGCVIPAPAGSSLCLIPTDEEMYDYNSSRVHHPCVFNLNTFETKHRSFSMSRERKYNPIAASIGRFVYSLSTGSKSYTSVPRFESLDPVTNKWTDLADPHFIRGCGVEGHAVLEDNFLLVSFSEIGAGGKDRYLYYSYNVRSDKWKPVDVVSSSDSIDHMLCGQGVVAAHDGIVYCYDYYSPMLLAFSFKVVDDDGEYDVSLGPISVVQGFRLDDGLEPKDPDDYPPDYNYTGAISQVDDGVLCVVHADCTYDGQKRPLSVSIVRVHSRFSCTTIKTFLCTLFFGDELSFGMIRSCHVSCEQLEEQSVNQVKDGLALVTETVDCRSGKDMVVMKV